MLDEMLVRDNMEDYLEMFRYLLDYFFIFMVLLGFSK